MPVLHVWINGSPPRKMRFVFSVIPFTVSCVKSLTRLFEWLFKTASSVAAAAFGIALAVMRSERQNHGGDTIMKALRNIAILVALSSVLVACGSFPYAEPCNSDSDCRNGSVCQQGACYSQDNSGLNNRTRPTRTSCQANSDCGEGLKCDTQLQFCRKTCQSNSDCREGSTCNSQTQFCQRPVDPNATKCQADGDCEEGQKCSLRRQVCMQTCESNTDCSDGKICSSRGKVCITPRKR